MSLGYGSFAKFQPFFSLIFNEKKWLKFGKTPIDQRHLIINFQVEMLILGKSKMYSGGKSW